MTRKEKIDVVNNKLSSCNRCGAIPNPRPFYFSKYNPDCKVMLITWKPSIQALYRPLFSTRFFRVLCLALFGANCERKDYIDIFNSGEIFWSHVQKCYSESQNKTAQDECSDFYITREFEIIKPKLVIVLGEEAKAHIKDKHEFTRSEKDDKCKWMYAGFPRNGMEKEFLDIRRELSRYITGIDVESYADDSLQSISYSIEDKISKHAAFELEGIERWVNQIYSKEILEEKDYDAKWFNLYVIPYFTSQAILSLSCSYFEEHIKMLLYHHGFTKKDFIYLKNDKGRENEIYICTEKLLEKLADATHGNKIITGHAEILKKVENLKRLRNKFVHEGGFLEKSYENKDTIEYFPIVSNGYNHIELTYENAMEIIGLMKQFVRMLDEIEGLRMK